MQTRLPHHQIVLLGAGHTNAHILRMWRMKPISDAQLICISDFPYATYSGMLPGTLAGQYLQEQMQIDLVRACAASRARLILSPVERIDPKAREIHFADRPALPFDLLSIGIGSVPSFGNATINSDRVLAIKPMQTFLSRLDAAIEKAETSGGANDDASQPFRATVVGGGAGGVEIAMCLLPHLRKLIPGREVKLTLVHGGTTLANNVTARTETVIRESLQSRGVELLLEIMVDRIDDRTVTLNNQTKFESDVVLWATGATASEQLRTIDLPQDDRGFLQIRRTLQSTGSDRVFVVGDSGSLVDEPTPKAGVYAVRQGKILYENMQRFVVKKALIEYKPQRDFMKLLNLGDGRGVGQYHGRTFKGRWVFALKDRIDRRFMEKHQNYEPAMMDAQPVNKNEKPEMRCQGCGGKVGGATLSNLFKRLDVKKNASVIMGLDQPDDAALIKSNSGEPLAISTDFFSSPIDDPYLVGRVAALNSTSDIYATGAKPTVALTMASVPEGHPRDQEQLLYEVLAGSLHELDQMNVSLVGGHTTEADRLTIGFTVVGEQNASGASRKSDLRAGDQLVMTQRLGIGILLAALMQAKCEFPWYQPLVGTMLKNNGFAVEILNEANIDTSAVTDITGFGLAGHLHEMVKASKMSARLVQSQLALLPGVSQLIAGGIESTLAPNNRWIEKLVQCEPQVRASAEFAALFDPQTNGGMLFAVNPSDLDRCLDLLRNGGFEDTVCIGEVIPQTDDFEIEIVDS